MTLHEQHEHIIMTEEDKVAALDYFELLKEQEAEISLCGKRKWKQGKIGSEQRGSEDSKGGKYDALPI